MARNALLAISLAAALAPAAAHAASSPFDSVVVFGDSLSDNGNLSIATGSAQIMRFTTNPGHVALEDVTAHYGLTLAPSLAGGTNFAYGGAGVLQNSPDALPQTVTISDQANAYLGAHTALDPRSLYTVFGGNNDLFYHITAAGAGQIADQLIAQATAGLTPDAAATVAAQIRTQIAAVAHVASVETPEQAMQGAVASAQAELSIIDRLQAAGATRVLVVNIPDLGLTPGSRAAGAQVQALSTALAATYDAQLDAGLAGRKGVVPVNTFALLREVVADPARYGFVNAVAPACTSDSSFTCTPATLVAPNAGATYVFADDVHPTTATHMAFAQAIISELTASGQMSLLSAAPLAFARDQRAAVAGELDAEMHPDAEDGVRLFVVGRAGRRHLSGDFDAPKSHSDDESATFGLMAHKNDLSVGAAVTTAQGVTRLSGGAGEFKPEGVLGIVYGQYRWSGGGWLTAEANVGNVDLDDIQRTFMMGAAERYELSTGQASVYGFSAQGGRWFKAPGGRFSPFAALSYDHARVDAIRELGADATAMWFAAQHREALAGKVGWKMEADWNWGAFAVQPSLSVAYGHDFKADRGTVTAGLVTLNGEFDMPGYAPAKDWGEVVARLGADIGAGFRAQIEYEGRYGDRANDNLGSIGVSYSF
jgi:outer membrane lipase/esterase